MSLINMNGKRKYAELENISKRILCDGKVTFCASGPSSSWASCELSPPYCCLSWTCCCQCPASRELDAAIKPKEKKHHKKSAFVTCTHFAPLIQLQQKCTKNVYMLLYTLQISITTKNHKVNFCQQPNY